MTTQDWTNVSILCLLLSNFANFVLICQLQRKVDRLEKDVKP